MENRHTTSLHEGFRLGRLWRTCLPTRFLPTVICTMPLLFFPGMLCLIGFDAFQFRQSGQFQERHIVNPSSHARYRLHQLADSYKKDFFPQPNPDVPVIRLHLPKTRIDKLNSNLPQSGFVETKGSIELAEGFQKLKFRYRGDHCWHWCFPKKSWRLKTKKDEILSIGRKIHLVNPKDGQFVIEYLNSRVAKRFGILGLPNDIAAVSINGEYQGLYLMSESTDESLLRNLQQMPGAIFFGDMSVRGVRVEFASNPYLWQLESIYNGPPAWQVHPLEELIRQVYAGDYWLHRRRLIDEQYMARFCAFISLIGSHHYDSFHNLNFFYEPLSGQFQMLEKDSTGWTFQQIEVRHKDRGVDIASNPFFLELLRNPVFVADKNRVLYDLISDSSALGEIKAEILKVHTLAAPYIENDKLDRQGFNWPAPDQFDKSIEGLEQFLQRRTDWLKKSIEDAQLGYQQQGSLLNLVADGIAPCQKIRISFDRPTPDGLSIFRQHDQESDNHIPIAYHPINEQTIELSETFYPGRVKENESRNTSMVPAPLSYLCRMEEIGEAKVVSITANNAITGDPAQIEAITEQATPTSNSIHPWQLMPGTKPIVTTISQPIYRVLEDWIIPENETVKFSPGVTIKMASGASILCYGKMVAQGEESRPIRFERDDPAQPWGVLGLQGSHAKESRFEQVIFEGGSHDALDGVYYSGMVSVYHVPGVEFSNCRFIENVLGDDALRAGKSSVDVLDCHFERANSDAIDFDYSKGLIRGNYFLDSGNDAIDLMTSDPIVQDNIIERAGDKGVSIGERSAPIVFNNDIRQASIGIEIKDASRPLIVNCKFQNCEIGVNSIQKNWRYGDGGHGRVYQTVWENCKTPVALDNRSDLQIVGSVIQDVDLKLVQQRRLSIRACGPSSVNMNNVDPQIRSIYQELGIAQTSNIGPSFPSSLAGRAVAILNDHFIENFRTDLSDWTVSKDARAVKSKNVLLLRTRQVGELTLQKQLDSVQLDRPGVFALEARSNGPATVHVRFESDAPSVESEFTLHNSFATQLIDLPQGNYKNIHIRIQTGAKIEIRGISINVPTANLTSERKLQP